jgi:hypothetical protein
MSADWWWYAEYGCADAAEEDVVVAASDEAAEAGLAAVGQNVRKVRTRAATPVSTPR